MLRIYRNALRTVLAMYSPQRSSADECESLACRCDDLTERVCEDSKYMAQKYAAFAGDLAAGFFHAQEPTGYSTVRDITQNSVMLGAQREALCAMIRSHYGQGAVKELFAELKKALEPKAVKS